ncbi:MAG: ATP-binding cassette domain-containing protein [Desulfotignum sp.]|nr:ATP-binding cassette domain-containing protein [Desulfotignum sp.]
MYNPIKIRVENLTFSYHKTPIFENVSLDFEAQTITAITGPSGRGKSTFLSILNRLWESQPVARMQGKVWIYLDGQWIDIYSRTLSKPDLRRKVGMVFQTPNPLPMSIYKNMAFPLKLTGMADKALVEAKITRALEQAFLWDEVKDRLNDSALGLSGGQQQRLCIARALVSQPEILLLDEPTSSLDTGAASVIEDLLVSLKERCTLIVVSHYLEQVSRIADTALKLKAREFRQV